ncbi:hypothetical protein SDRG_12179 [Saprolegnia diclina VS20]|uniref:Uncharacterized protein n=1 Tax=Saprolegnia diclina (strain VS20) TaxID=1156394 RepID=T0Q9G5_SAPDV|nr:hypothetical protein SDRG_12179 [Saprolegnia diclina VS20]EQC30120.1 hypothetical protein SDRG_12179 [Saprolegnia diclina VS20]|eukprot:XP_008616463.1 hypothetical protein SDRG_12179 [Saprolegnia diclina VS20]
MDLTLVLHETTPLDVAAIVDSDVNLRGDALAVTDGSVLVVYANVSTKLERRLTLPAADGERFLRLLYIEWINAFLVLSQKGSSIYRKFLSANANTLDDATLLCADGDVLDCVINSVRHEVLSADTHGGLKVWSARLRPPTASHPSLRRDTVKCPQRLHIQDTKSTVWHRVCVDDDNQRIFAASARSIRMFDAVSGHVIWRLPKAAEDRSVRFLVYVPPTQHLLVYADETARFDVWVVHDTAKGTSLVEDTPLTVCANVVALQLTTVVESPSRTRLDGAFVTKPGFGSLVVTDRAGHVSLFQIEATGYSLSVASFYVPPLGLPTSSLTMRSTTDTAPAWTGIHCNFHFAARNYISLLHANGTLAQLEVLAPSSTSRLLTSSTRLYNLRDFGFTKATRGAALRRGYVLFGNAFVQVFEDACLAVSALATDRNDGAEIQDGSNPIITFLDYAPVLAKCVVGWSDGAIDLFTITGTRWKLLKRPSGVIADCVCAFACATNNTADSESFLFTAGDADGSLDTWQLHDHVATYLGPMAAHTDSVLAILSPLASAKPPGGTPPSTMVTVSCDGNVKQWDFLDRKWLLVGCFRTLSNHLTVARGLEMNYICAGSDEGSVEVWKLPLATPLHFGTSKKAVAHVAHAHARPIADINVYQIIGATPDLDFTLLATSAKDGSILFWLFGTSLDGASLLSFQSIATSHPVCGTFFSATATPGSITFVGCFPHSLDKLCVMPASKKALVALALDSSAPTSVVAPSSPPRPPPLPSIPDVPDTDKDYFVHVEMTAPIIELHMDVEEKPRSTTRHTLVDTVSSNLASSDMYGLSAKDDSDDDDDVNAPPMIFPPSRAKTKAKKHTPWLPPALARGAPRTYKTKPPPLEATPKRLNVVSAYGVSSQHCDSLSMHYPTYKLDTAARPRKAAIQNQLPMPLMTLLEHKEALPPEVHIVDVAVRPATIENGPAFWLQVQTKAAARRRTALIPSAPLASLVAAPQPFSIEMLELPWVDLSSSQQMVELQCSVLCLAVLHAAEVDCVDLPTAPLDGDLSATDRAVWNRYTLWYLHKSNARKLFLKQELLYVLSHDDVVKQTQMLGLAVPRASDAESQNHASPLFFRWARFCLWYTRGLVAGSVDELQWLVDEADDEPKRMSRLEERTLLLRERLQQIEQAKYDFEVLQKRELTRMTAASKAAAIMLQRLKRPVPVPKIVLPPELVALELDFFQPIALPDGTRLEFVPWESMSTVEQEKELALAMNDVRVRLEAMRHHIILPDEVSALALDDEGLVRERCAAFLTWWTTTNNPTRMEFLRHEAKEAAADETVKVAASQVGIDVAFYTALQAFHQPGKPPLHRDADLEAHRDVYHDWYFQVANAEHLARVEFLKQKVLKLKRQLRLQMLLELGRMPRPLLYEIAPAPRLAFDVDEVKSKPEPVVAPPIEIKEVKPVLEAPAIVEVREKIDYDALAKQRKAKERQQWEDEMLLSNRAQMESEDAAAQLWRSMDDEHEDEVVEEPAPRVRAARDYTQSYFFSSLPSAQDAYAIAGLGWRAGCGLYNGDEEAEVREVRELERLRQLELDRLDRLRIAEEERLAALALAEKEREEERKAEKRARAVELKRILAFQKELATQRELERQHAARERETAAMDAEEHRERQRLADLVRERALMTDAEAETRFIATAIVKARRHDAETMAANRVGMLAEDARSRDAAAHAVATERARRERIGFLKELYTPFEPFFAGADEDDGRCLAPELRPTTEHRRYMDNYTMSFGDALVLETPAAEVYAAQPSKRFQALLGVPINYRRFAPPSTPYANVAASMETLARARAVPGIDVATPGVPMAPVRSRPHTTLPPSGEMEMPLRAVHTSGWSPERSGTPSKRRTKYRRRQTPTVLSELPMTLGGRANNQQNDDVFRQSTLPPPFFRGNFTVVGKQPETTTRRGATPKSVLSKASSGDDDPQAFAMLPTD